MNFKGDNMNVHLINECACGSKYGNIEQGSTHKKLTCAECLRFIKFVGKHEHYRQVIEEEKEAEALEDTFKEINFKLDLILDHLGIKI